MKLNTAPRRPRPAVKPETPAPDLAQQMAELRRSVACCLLWEDSFYERGEDINTRLVRLSAACPVDFVHSVAVEARTVHGLRHVPLLLARELARRPDGRVAELLPQVITRADQLSEFVALYMETNGGRRVLSAQVKKGLARAFERFDAYALAKNDHQRADWSLKDVAKLVHARRGRDPQGFVGEQYTPERTKPGGSAPKTRGSVLEQLCLGTLPTPDTWEVALSQAHTPDEKKAIWERLLAEGKLGGLAWLRNLRNMYAVGVSESAIFGNVPSPERLAGLLPHQVLTAAKVNPWARQRLGGVLSAASEGLPRSPGRTLVLVDVSGSMNQPLARQADTRRLEAAYGLALHAQAVFPDCVIATFSDALCVCYDAGSKSIIPAYGFALMDRMDQSQRHNGTYISATLRQARDKLGTFERTLLITDGESSDGIQPPLGRGFEMNVAAYEQGVGGTDWVTISGWSPRVLTYVQEYERLSSHGL